TGRFSWPHIPVLREVHGGPRPPGLGSIINAESALETRIFARKSLAPQVPLQAGMVTYRGAIAAARMLENCSALADVFGPGWLSIRIESLEEVVGAALRKPMLRNAGEDHAVGRLVGAAVVVRVDVNEIIPRAC